MRISAKTRGQLKWAKTLRSGGVLKHSKVSLCVYSPSIDITKLTALLGCAPTHTQVRGQLTRPKSVRPATIGLWSLEAPKRLPFDEKVRYLLDATTKSLPTWRRIARTHDVQLRCGIFLHSWNEGFELPPQTVVEVGARGWKLGVDIYSAEGDEVLDAFLSTARNKRGK